MVRIRRQRSRTGPPRPISAARRQFGSGGFKRRRQPSMPDRDHRFARHRAGERDDAIRRGKQVASPLHGQIHAAMPGIPWLRRRIERIRDTGVSHRPRHRHPATLHISHGGRRHRGAPMRNRHHHAQAECESPADAGHGRTPPHMLPSPLLPVSPAPQPIRVPVVHHSPIPSVSPDHQCRSHGTLKSSRARRCGRTPSGYPPKHDPHPRCDTPKLHSCHLRLFLSSCARQFAGRGTFLRSSVGRASDC